MPDVIVTWIEAGISESEQVPHDCLLSWFVTHLGMYVVSVIEA